MPAGTALRAIFVVQTLDLFVHLCKQRGYPHVRLDGTIAQNKRQKLVTAFNNPQASRVLTHSTFGMVDVGF